MELVFMHIHSLFHTHFYVGCSISVKGQTVHTLAFVLNSKLTHEAHKNSTVNCYKVSVAANVLQFIVSVQLHHTMTV